MAKAMINIVTAIAMTAPWRLGVEALLVDAGMTLRFGGVTSDRKTIPFLALLDRNPRYLARTE
jgi:hypothetical protein